MKENIRNKKSRDKLSEIVEILEKIVEMHKFFKKIFFGFVCVKWLKLVLKHLLRTAFIQ